MKLEHDEKVLLDNNFPSSRKKLVLTNKRLIIHEKKGIVGLKKEVINEIPLGQIKEVHGAIDTLTSCSSLILNLKDGEQIQFTFKLLHVGIANPEESKKITDKYLTAINHQINNFQT